MNDPETRSARDESLDKDLAALKAAQPTAPAYLQQRILANLPEREPMLELLDWLRASAWRPVTAAALPLMFGGDGSQPAGASNNSQAGRRKWNWASSVMPFPRPARAGDER